MKYQHVILAILGGLISCFSLFLSVPGAHAAADESPDSPQHASQETNAIKTIVHITESGLVPKITELTKKDSSVFLYNSLNTTSVDIAIAFGENRVHCHSPRISVQDGNLVTTSPLIPNSFVILCFPDSDRYPITVSRVGSNGPPLTGEVVVK